MFNHNNYFDKDSIDKFIILIIIKIFVIRLKFQKQREFVELLSLVEVITSFKLIIIVKKRIYPCNLEKEIICKI